MLKLNPDPQFTEEVQVTVPGKKDPGIFKLTFKYKSKKNIENLQQEVMGRVGEGKLDHDFVVQKFNEIVAGWEDMDAEFNEENINTFLDNYPAAFGEILRRYTDLSYHSRIKN